ncbi:MAG: NAD(P)-binding domain-containing protein, partial [Burkholderiales bacterium]
MRLAILGAGAWGAALAGSLSDQHAVRLWARDPQRAADITASRRNPYLPDVPVPAAVDVTSDMAVALAGAELALVTSPIAGLRATLGQVRAAAQGVPVVWGCKGFEQASGRLPHEVAAE